MEEQRTLFEQLGSSTEATVKRAKLQSGQLLADMEAFKAANPGSTLADFVRWHSPRDWVRICANDASSTVTQELETPADDVHGQLSVRMRKPGNLWIDLWRRALERPVCEQEPIFDSVLEAEKALTFLETVTLGELLLQYVIPSALISQFAYRCIALFLFLVC